MAFIAENLSRNDRKSTSGAGFMIVKNVLFWGSIALTGYALYAVATL
ncbi:hypothetical protein [Roseibium sp.]